MTTVPWRSASLVIAGRCATFIGRPPMRWTRRMTRRRHGSVVSFIRLDALAWKGPMPVTIKRREFLTAIGGATAWPFAARGSSLALPVIGLLSGVSFESYANRRDRNVSYQDTAV
jgi:hypothetical protein